VETLGKTLDNDQMKTLADLKIGEKGIIKGFDDEVMALKLLEMGCLPNTEVCLSHVAPSGDPIAIRVSGYSLSMRKDEARTILLEA
jgi:ferrous iron transport protein A